MKPELRIGYPGDENGKPWSEGDAWALRSVIRKSRFLHCESSVARNLRNGRPQIFHYQPLAVIGSRCIDLHPAGIANGQTQHRPPT